jgi:hypothetical protein
LWWVESGTAARVTATDRAKRRYSATAGPDSVRRLAARVSSARTPWISVSVGEAKCGKLPRAARRTFGRTTSRSRTATEGRARPAALPRASAAAGRGVVVAVAGCDVERRRQAPLVVGAGELLPDVSQGRVRVPVGGHDDRHARGLGQCPGRERLRGVRRSPVLLAACGAATLLYGIAWRPVALRLPGPDPDDTAGPVEVADSGDATGPEETAATIPAPSAAPTWDTGAELGETSEARPNMSA